MTVLPLKRLKLSNFKSFKEATIDFDKFTVIIGANGAGKSNLVQALRFLRDIRQSGLDNAISMQGGIEYLANMGCGSKGEVAIEVTTGESGWARRKGDHFLGIKASQTVFSFALRLRRGRPGYEVIRDTVTQYCDVIRLSEAAGKGGIEEKEKLGSGTITFAAINGRVDIQTTLPSNVGIEAEDLHFPLIDLDDSREIPANTLIMEQPTFRVPILATRFTDVGIYDFDPKLPKKAIPITGKATLEEDGGNVSLVLKNIVADKEKKRKLSNLVRDLLPFVSDIGVEKVADKSLLFKLRECYPSSRYLPASLVSDGTINITAIVVALFFQDKTLTVIEEPERSIHPHLLSRLVGMMIDASANKQVIITTHNPQIVKHAHLENMLLVSRHSDGCSSVSRPSEKAEVRTFLQNEIGIDTLFVDNLLEIPGAN